MKRLILINGTMGVGKSAVSRCIQRLLPACALLDGDWCWNVHPFSVTEESKRRVIDHIVTVLHGYLGCADVQNVVFFTLSFYVFQKDNFHNYYLLVLCIYYITRRFFCQVRNNLFCTAQK